MREMQTTTTMRCYLTLVSMAIIKKYLHIVNAGEGVEESEPSHSVAGIVNWYNYYGEQCEGS